MEDKIITFLDENDLGVPNVTVHSDANETQVSGSDGSVTFAGGKKSFYVDEASAPPTEVKKVITNFMIKTIS